MSVLSWRLNVCLLVFTNKEVGGVILIIDMKRLKSFPRFEDSNKATIKLWMAAVFTAIIIVMGANQP